MTRTPQYILEHFAGAIASQYAPQTGFVVTIYRARDADLDESAGKYGVTCEEHNCVVMVRTLGAARAFSRDTIVFCSACCTLVERRTEAAKHPEVPELVETIEDHKACAGTCGLAICTLAAEAAAEDRRQRS